MNWLCGIIAEKWEFFSFPVRVTQTTNCTVRLQVNAQCSCLCYDANEVQWLMFCHFSDRRETYKDTVCLLKGTTKVLECNTVKEDLRESWILLGQNAYHTRGRKLMDDLYCVGNIWERLMLIKKSIVSCLCNK